MNGIEFTEKCALLWGTNNVQIQVKCKCRASAKTSEGDHLEDVETSCFNIFSKQNIFLASLFQNSFSYLNCAASQKEKKG